MTRVMLLRALKDFTLDATRDLLLPVRVQSAEEEPQERPAEVHLMRLPDSSAAKMYSGAYPQTPTTQKER